ncbi:MAG: hypothetical protein JSU01_11800 [Bacteroidetes bacterium]|nr:hypothetical protein [Bacteroidota bacterium]
MMNNDHLNDETLQRYTLNEEISMEAINHIDNCVHCRQLADQYKALNYALQQQAVATFNFDTTLLVPAALEQKPQFSWFGLLIAFAIFTGLLLITLALASFGKTQTGWLTVAIGVPVFAASAILLILQHLRSWRLLSQI